MAHRLALLCVAAVGAAPGVFDVTSYGGVGDGTTLNTQPFRDAVAAAHAFFVSSGAPGTVVASAGTFLSGQIVLLSGVTLSVAPEARLLASFNASDYPADESKWAFIYADGANDLRITGGGTIDGNFEQYISGFSAVNDEFTFQGWPGCSGAVPDAGNTNRGLASGRAGHDVNV